MRETEGANRREEHPEEAPPLLGSWRRLYSAVILWLLVLICAFYLFARRYSP